MFLKKRNISSKIKRSKVTDYAASSVRHAHGDLCKHLGIDSSTDDRYINRHAHTKYLKMI